MKLHDTHGAGDRWRVGARLPCSLAMRQLPRGELASRPSGLLAPLRGASFVSHGGAAASAQPNAPRALAS